MHLIRDDRPAFLVRRGGCVPPLDDPWRAALAGPGLTRAIACVGRLASSELARLSLGTAWRIRPDVLVTNRHVALYLDERRRAGAAVITIDFAGEHLGEDRSSHIVGDILYIAEDHDLAFMALPKGGLQFTTSIPLCERPCQPGVAVCAIGFPADNTRFFDPAPIARIFDGIYDVKRVAPGEILAATDQRIDHDCTTLGGNSGSVLLALASGEAVGLHTDGVPFVRNHAVPVAVIRERLALLRP